MLIHCGVMPYDITEDAREHSSAFGMCCYTVLHSESRANTFTISAARKGVTKAKLFGVRHGDIEALLLCEVVFCQ